MRFEPGTSRSVAAHLLVEAGLKSESGVRAERLGPGEGALSWEPTRVDSRRLCLLGETCSPVPAARRLAGVIGRAPNIVS